MLMLLGECGNLRDLGFRYFIAKHTADTPALRMDFEHDARGLRAIQSKYQLENLNNELHRRVIIIEQQDTIQRRLPGLRPSLFENQTMILIRPCLEIPVAAHCQHISTNIFHGCYNTPSGFAQSALNRLATQIDMCFRVATVEIKVRAIAHATNIKQCCG